MRLTLLLALLLSCLAQAEVKEQPRPKIALVLAGGGARGAAHVGVLKVLEDNRIPVDMVTGTSMGAFVGGLYASGKSADEIDSLMRQLDWNQGYQEDPGRSAQSLRKKEQRDRFQLGLNLGLSDDGQLKVPKGLLQGQAMVSLVRQSLGDLPNFQSFDELPIPFRCVATNIENKDAVVMDHGNLAQALQASMAVPGILRPVERDGLLLVDGGVVNNMPVDVAKAMGADIVIAVDVNSPFHDRQDLDSALAIMDQLSRFLVRDNMDRQKALLGDRDLLIKPQLESVSMLDFHLVGAAVDAGEQATLAWLDKLRPLALPEAQYQAWRRQHSAGGQVLTIDAIVIDSDAGFDHRWMREQLGVKAGAPYNQQQLDLGINRLYATELFERIDYELVEQEGKRVLRVKARERSWGPGYLNFRLAVEDNFTDASDYQLGMSYTRTNLSSLGAEWHNEVELGLVKRAMTELYWPFDADQDFFALGNLEFRKQPLREVLAQDQGNVLIEVNRKSTTYKAALGSNFNRWSRIQLGWRYVDGSLEDDLGIFLPPISGSRQLNYQQSGPFLLWQQDTLDSRTFPRRGQRWELELRRTRDQLLGNSSSNSYFLGKWQGALSSGPHALAFEVQAGSYFNDDASPLDSFELGGFRKLSGFGRLALSGNHMRFASLDYSYRLFENNFGFFKSPVFLGMTLEGGNTWDRRDQISMGDLVKAASLYAGIDSPIGPLFFAYGQNSEDESSFYFALGADF